MLGERYQILDLLGEGGMGAVYKARDRELDRLVALKIIRPNLALSAEILRRFKQELILARQVTHRNVVRIYDLAQADGIKFITMDYIEGRDLSSLLREKGKFASKEAAQIMEQVCRALEAAHMEGVIHRDLKPQNIMIDAHGKVSVMDFGIARSTEVVEAMTYTGAMIGTPQYMSPEQAKGEKFRCALRFVFVRNRFLRIAYRKFAVQSGYGHVVSFHAHNASGAAGDRVSL
jgi:serine/threonine protein kinase